MQYKHKSRQAPFCLKIALLKGNALRDQLQKALIKSIESINALHLTYSYSTIQVIQRYDIMCNVQVSYIRIHQLFLVSAPLTFNSFQLTSVFLEFIRIIKFMIFNSTFFYNDFSLNFFYIYIFKILLGNKFVMAQLVK